MHQQESEALELLRGAIEDRDVRLNHQHELIERQRIQIAELTTALLASRNDKEFYQQRYEDCSHQHGVKNLEIAKLKEEIEKRAEAIASERIAVFSRDRAALLEERNTWHHKAVDRLKMFEERAELCYSLEKKVKELTQMNEQLRLRDDAHLKEIKDLRKGGV